ncbi:MAG: Fic family protein [Candidatus Absconditabacteria bacterium]
MFDPKSPFNIPMLPNNFDFNQVEILKLALKANNAIAKLNSLVLVLPNPQLLVKPLLSKESVESSAIENIFTTTQEFLKAETIDKNNIIGPEKQVASYKQSLFHGFQYIKEHGIIHTNLIVDIGNIIEPNKGGVRKIPGTVIANSYGETIYTPPVGEDTIRKYLTNLENFININNDVDPLIKAGVIHYQFESIHPFYDGNGRTGRVLLVLYLVMCGKLDYPILFISEYINKNKTKYYQILHNTTQSGDYKEIIMFILQAIEIQANITSQKIIAINKLINKISGIIEDEKIVKFIFSNPYISIKSMSNEIGITRQTASKYIKKLQELEILETVNYNKSKLYFNPQFIDILS